MHDFFFLLVLCACMRVVRLFPSWPCPPPLIAQVRPRIRLGRVQHCGGERLQHGRDGEQGLERVQHRADLGQAQHRYGCRLRAHRVRGKRVRDAVTVTESKNNCGCTGWHRDRAWLMVFIWEHCFE